MVPAHPHDRSFFAVPSSAPYRIDLYESFIKDFASKLDPLKHASIAVAVARTYSDARSSLLPRHPPPTFDTPATREPFVLVSMERGHFLLLLGQPEAAKEGDGPVSEGGAAERARDLGIAALLGESLYNFGELVSPPSGSDSLKGTPNEYIRSLLFAFNRGDIDKFQSLIPELEKEASQPTYAALRLALTQDTRPQPYLLQNLNTLRQKICVLALIEAVFKRPTQDRVALPFSIIAKEAQVPVDEVEHLVMKALMCAQPDSRHARCLLVRRVHHLGSTRVLDKTQIGGLKDRLGEWADKVQAQGAFARGVAPELFG
ncbi:26S proteasome regulatory subunit N9 [Rhodotorula toruloides]|uniref:26S proteasome regulatory subunit N9 n=1 Tax=Rhodotorula toruloides TaxID=5286 RepID=A0A511KR65_RHOTO|nr:26S proteasome regulatory subunit N9 [Rhodotorula toruloides]